METITFPVLGGIYKRTFLRWFELHQLLLGIIHSLVHRKDIVKPVEEGTTMTSHYVECGFCVAAVEGRVHM